MLFSVCLPASLGLKAGATRPHVAPLAYCPASGTLIRLDHQGEVGGFALLRDIGGDRSRCLAVA